MRPRLVRRLRVLAPLAMMAAIFYFSAQPFDGPELAWWEVALRKLGHVAGYAVLTLPLVVGAGRPRRPAARCWRPRSRCSTPCSDEYHQTFVDNRTGTVMDVGIDAVGIALACVLISRRWPRPASREPAAEGSAG